MDSRNKDMLVAHAQLGLADPALDRSENDTAHRLLYGFREDWSSGDEHLSLSQLASALEGRLGGLGPACSPEGSVHEVPEPKHSHGNSRH